MATLAPKRYVRQNFKIPFYESSSQLYKVKARVSPKIKNKDELRTSIDDLRDDAIVYYITHYFPEFYTYLYNQAAFEQMLPEGEGLELAEDLIGDIKRTITAENYFSAHPPHTDKSIVVFKTSYDFFEKRDELLTEDKMPSFEANQTFFREKNNITDPTSGTTLNIITLGGQSSAVNDGLRIFNEALAFMEGQMSVNLDFGAAQASVQPILNMMVTDIVQHLRRTADKKLTDADTLTVLFGKKEDKSAVVGMEYLAAEESIQSSPLKVGNFSAVLYSRAFRDPMTVAILQNYSNIAQGAAGGSTGGSSFSFYDFINDESVISALGTPGAGSLFSDPNYFTTGSVSGSFPRPLSPAELAARERDEVQNEYVKVARSLGIISANDVQALTKGFKEAYTNEEVEKIKREIENNPEVVRRVFAAQATKKLQQAAKTIDMVENILQEGPLGLMDKSPEGRRVKRFFKAFGIDQIMKEVMLCLTFGLNFEASRIASAAASAIQSQALSVYYRKPEPPKPFMEMPKFDPKMFLPKMRDGNIGEIIKKAVVDALQESAISVIKRLAELISEVCEFNNPAAHDYGANDINSLLNEGDFQSGLDGLALKNNLDPQILRTYLSALSRILSSVDVCNLFSPISRPPLSLINRIITFNEGYDNVFIQQGLTDISSLTGFINELSAFVDVSDLCDEIANMAYVLNQDDVCLALADAPDLGELAVAVPELNFDCMDKENFINDPTITKTIPEVFNMVAETVEVQFINSAGTLKEILLQPVMVRGSDSNVLPSFDAASAIRPDGISAGDDLQELDTGPLSEVQNQIDSVMDKLRGDIGIIEELVADCDPHPSDVLGFSINNNTIDLFEQVITEIASALADSKFEAGLNGLSTQLGNLALGEGPVVRTYRFKQDFYRAFESYVRTNRATFADEKYIAPNYFSSGRTVLAGQDISLTSSVTYSLDDTYLATTEPLQLKFGFPTFGGPSTAEEYLRVTYPNNVPGHSQLISIDYKSTSGLVLDDGLMLNLEQSLADQVQAQLGNSGTDPTNIYIQQFVNSYVDSSFYFEGLTPSLAESSRAAATDELTPHVVHQEFPKMYASLVQNMIEYILENGAFDAATLQSLQLFHVNTDCPEDEASDLLDIQGILEQVTREYAEQACNDRDVSLRDKFRRALKFGLTLLYVQLSIAEFIVKNIFVFAAFTIDSMLQDRNSFLFRFFRKQAKLSLIKFLETPIIDSRLPNFRPENLEAVKTDLLSYFNKKIARESVIANGGIRYSHEPQDVVFPPGTVFTKSVTAGPRATFDDILDYLITERLFFARTPINNVIKKALDRAGKYPRPMNEALISSYPVLRDGSDSPSSQSRIQLAAQIAFGNHPNVFVLDEVDDPHSQPPIPAQRRSYSLWFYTGEEVGPPVAATTGNVDARPAEAEVSIGTGAVVELLSNLYTRMTWISQGLGDTPAGEETSAPSTSTATPGGPPTAPGSDYVYADEYFSGNGNCTNERFFEWYSELVDYPPNEIASIRVERWSHAEELYGHPWPSPSELQEAGLTPLYSSKAIDQFRIDQNCPDLNAGDDSNPTWTPPGYGDEETADQSALNAALADLRSIFGLSPANETLDYAFETWMGWYSADPGPTVGELDILVTAIHVYTYDQNRGQMAQTVALNDLLGVMENLGIDTSWYSPWMMN